MTFAGKLSALPANAASMDYANTIRVKGSSAHPAKCAASVSKGERNALAVGTMSTSMRPKTSFLIVVLHI